jgi:uncharacterized protein (DUF2236 family)
VVEEVEVLDLLRLLVEPLEARMLEALVEVLDPLLLQEALLVGVSLAMAVVLAEEVVRDPLRLLEEPLEARMLEALVEVLDPLLLQVELLMVVYLAMGEVLGVVLDPLLPLVGLLVEQM